jgi:hypothetical protein
MRNSSERLFRNESLNGTSWRLRSLVGKGGEGELLTALFLV